MKVIAQAEVLLPTREGDKQEWSYTSIKVEDGDDVFQARSSNRRTSPLEMINLLELEIEALPIRKGDL